MNVLIRAVSTPWLYLARGGVTGQTVLATAGQ